MRLHQLQEHVTEIENKLLLSIVNGGIDGPINHPSYMKKVFYALKKKGLIEPFVKDGKIRKGYVATDAGKAMINNKANESMPSGGIKHKQRLVQMTDQELATNTCKGCGCSLSDPEPGCKCKRKHHNVMAESKKLTALTEAQFDEAAGEKDACYRKVKSRYKVWPSAYASGALTKCRKVGAANWGKDKKK